MSIIDKKIGLLRANRTAGFVNRVGPISSKTNQRISAFLDVRRNQGGARSGDYKLFVQPLLELYDDLVAAAIDANRGWPQAVWEACKTATSQREIDVEALRTIVRSHAEKPAVPLPGAADFLGSCQRDCQRLGMPGLSDFAEVWAALERDLRIKAPLAAAGLGSLLKRDLFTAMLAIDEFAVCAVSSANGVSDNAQQQRKPGALGQMAIPPEDDKPGRNRWAYEARCREIPLLDRAKHLFPAEVTGIKTHRELQKQKPEVAKRIQRMAQKHEKLLKSDPQ